MWCRIGNKIGRGAKDSEAETCRFTGPRQWKVFYQKEIFNEAGTGKQQINASWKGTEKHTSPNCQKRNSCLSTHSAFPFNWPKQRYRRLTCPLVQPFQARNFKPGGNFPTKTAEVTDANSERLSLFPGGLAEDKISSGLGSRPKNVTNLILSPGYLFRHRATAHCWRFVIVDEFITAIVVITPQFLLLLLPNSGMVFAAELQHASREWNFWLVYILLLFQCTTQYIPVDV